MVPAAILHSAGDGVNKKEPPGEFCRNPRRLPLCHQKRRFLSGYARRLNGHGRRRNRFFAGGWTAFHGVGQLSGITNAIEMQLKYRAKRNITVYNNTFLYVRTRRALAGR